MDNRFNANFGGFSDTGEWRLILYISDSGMSAFLKNADNVAQAPRLLFTTSWEKDDNPLLPKIENVVYDNPNLLDDYATEIILQTPRSLLIPTKVIEEEEGAEEKYFAQIYSTEPTDIHTDDLGDATCVYSLTPGLPAFVRRTLPGAKVMCHLSHLIRRFRQETSPSTRIYVDIRNNEADILIFNGNDIIMAATHTWREVADIAYHIFAATKCYEIKPEDIEAKLCGNPEQRGELATILRDFIPHVDFLPLPGKIGDLRLPTAVGMLLS